VPASRRQDLTAVEDYLKTIWGLTEWDTETSVAQTDVSRAGISGPGASGREVTNAAVAERLRVSTSSVSEMVRKLTREGLVDHEPWGVIDLTVEGRRQATAVVRRHRLLETFLFRLLGYSWDEVHEEAEVLEHAVSPLPPVPPHSDAWPREQVPRERVARERVGRSNRAHQHATNLARATGDLSNYTNLRREPADHALGRSRVGLSTK
jgi:hypothetical protein